MTSAPDDSGDSQGPAHAFDEGVPTIPPPAPRRQAGSLSGRTIDGYHIGELIGEGGMGEVYVAEQRDPIRMKVAFKVIKAGLSTKDVLKRFDMERQALAVMNHPAICRVLNAGSTPEHRPYFVMEHVSGKRITEYCDDNKLPIRARLELFGKVCEAVQHAHTKGIIHRDLKPSNVMVTEVDGKAVPKVIDFGVAKALNQPLTDATLMHEAGRMIGTLEYMSPEQAGGDPDIDTRADIYSLGVLLYELLTGAPPFPGELLRRKGYDEMRRIIREDAPPSPSTFYSRISTESQTAAARRAETVEHLAKTLRRELEWIPLYAMRKERGRRYVTAAEFGRDIDNYLAKKPLIAGPDSWWYRTGKTIKRNKGAVAAAAGIVLALLMGIAGTTWQMYEAREAEGRAKESATEASRAKIDAEIKAAEALAASKEAERRREMAELDFARAEARGKILNQFFAGVTPNRARQMDTKLILTIMDEIVDSLDTLLPNDPAARAGHLHMLGEVYKQLGNPRALDLLQRGLVLEREALDIELRKEGIGPGSGPVPSDVRSRLSDRVQGLSSALQRMARWHADEGQNEQAASLMQQSIDVLEDFGTPDVKEHVQSIMALSALYQRMGKLDEAEQMFDLGIERARRLSGFLTPLRAAGYRVNWSYLQAQKEDFDAALAGLSEAQAIYQQEYEKSGRSIGSGLLDLYATRAQVLSMAGRANESISVIDSCIDGRRLLNGEDHPAVATDIERKSYYLELLQRTSEAADTAAEALKIREANLPRPDNSTSLRQVATKAKRVAELMKRAGRESEATELLRRADAFEQRAAALEASSQHADRRES